MTASLLQWVTKGYCFDQSGQIMAIQLADLPFSEPERAREIPVEDCDITDEIRQSAIETELAYREFKGLPVERCEHGTYNFERTCAGCYDDGEREFYYRF